MLNKSAIIICILWALAVTIQIGNCKDCNSNIDQEDELIFAHTVSGIFMDDNIALF